MPASARVHRVPSVLTASTSRFPFVHSQAWSLFPPDECLQLPFLFGRFRDRCAIFQAPLAVDSPCDAISWLRLEAHLRQEISIKKNLARTGLRRRKRKYPKKEKQDRKKSRPTPPHAGTSRGTNQAAGKFSFHRRRELGE